MLFKFRISLAAFVLIFLATTLFAQINRKFYFQNYTMEDGLPSNAVYSIFQDSLGFMWLGTRQGIVRYDGTEFKVFQNVPSSSNSLSMNNAGEIFYDSRDTIWVGTWGNGIDLLDPRTFRFENFSPEEYKIGKRIRNIFEDDEGTIWFAFNNAGVSRLKAKNRKSKRFENFTFVFGDSASISSNKVYAITEDYDGNLWFGTSKGLCKLRRRNREKGTFERFELPVSDKEVRAVYVTKRNDLLVGVKNGFYKISSPSDFKSFSSSAKYYDLNKIRSQEGFYVISFFEDRNGNIWAGSNFYGITIFDSNYVRTKNLFSKPTEKHGFKGNAVTCFFEDASHNLWIGTVNSGVSRTDLKKKEIRSYFIPDEKVTGITCDKRKRIWLATKNGLKIFDNAVRKISLGEYDKMYFSLIATDYYNDIWAVANGKRLVKINSKNFALTEQKKINDLAEINETRIVSVIPDRVTNGKFIWIILRDGQILKYDVKKNTFKNYLIISTGNFESINVGFQDSKGNLWLGSLDGLGFWRYDEKILQKEMPLLLKVYKHKKGVKNSLVSNYVTVVAEDSLGRIWAGTINGISRISFDSGKVYFKNFTRENNLPSSAVMGILADKKNNLWVSTEFGFAFLKYNSRRFRRYSVVDGLPDNRFAQLSFYATIVNGEEKFFFGGFNGFISFNPATIKKNFYRPKVAVSEIILFENKTMLPVNSAYLKSIELPYYNNSFLIKLASLEFTNPSENQFLYCLEGYDSHWRKPYAHNKVLFTKLPPGRYFFKYACSNNNNRWKRGKPLEIIILPPYWATWWFRILAVLLFSIVVLVWIRKNINHVKELEAEIEERKKIERELRLAKEKAEEAEKVKSAFLAQISHEIRTPIYTISNSVEVFKNFEFYDKETLLFSASALDKAGERIVRTIDLVLRMADLQNGFYKPIVHKINLVEIVQSVFSRYQREAEEKGLRFVLETDEKEIFINADPDAVELILNNVLNNGVKFTEAGEVAVEVCKDNEKVKVCVKDTGTGISDEAKKKIFNPFVQGEYGYKRKYDGAGLGLTVSLEYCKYNNCSLVIEKRKTVGTIVTLTFDIAD